MGKKEESQPPSLFDNLEFFASPETQQKEAKAKGEGGKKPKTEAEEAPKPFAEAAKKGGTAAQAAAADGSATNATVGADGKVVPPEVQPLPPKKEFEYGDDLTLD